MSMKIFYEDHSEESVRRIEISQGFFHFLPWKGQTFDQVGGGATEETVG